MPSVRLILPVLIALLLVGCGRVDDQGLVRALEAAGCEGVPAAQYQRTTHGVVLSVSVQQCRASDGGLLPAADAHERMARVTWSTRTHRFDGLLVTVYRSDEDPARTSAHSAEFRREAIVSRFGPRHPALDAGETNQDRESAAWTIVPVVAGVIGILMLTALLRGVRSGRVVPVWIVRV